MLIQNTQDGIASIEWTIADKIRKVVTTVNTKPTLEYGYDALNNRQGKKSINADGSYIQTLYVNDATGKAMAIYTKEHSAAGVDTYTLKEQNIFGSSRMGSFAAAQDLSSTTAVEFAKNRFRFELTDHLGNVRAVVSGTKTLEGNPIVLNLTDYYPYGMDMPNRTFVNEAYRYGFNGKERDNLNGSSAVYDYGFRIYEARIGRFLSVDPLYQKFPWYTPYQFAGNKPIFGLDLDGAEELPYLRKFPANTGTPVDYPNAVLNGISSVYNFIAQGWNSGVQVGRSVKNGTFKKDLSDLSNHYKSKVKDIPEDLKTLKDRLTSDAKTLVNDPIGQTVNLGEYLLSPDFVEQATQFYIWGKILKAPESKGIVQDAETNVPKRAQNQSVKGGAVRAAKYSNEWGSSSLGNAIEKFAPGSEGVTTSTGKMVYKNGKTGIQVVYDESGNYFRIEDTKLSGKRKYLDLDGNIPNNKIVDGKQTGRSQAEYNEVTHFNNSDVK